MYINMLINIDTKKEKKEKEGFGYGVGNFEFPITLVTNESSTEKEHSTLYQRRVCSIKIPDSSRRKNEREKAERVHAATTGGFS